MLPTGSFIQKISECINEGLKLVGGDEKRQQVGYRLKFLIANLSICPDNNETKYKVFTTLRNLVHTLKYFKFHNTIDKHFESEMKREAKTKCTYGDWTHLDETDIQSVFIQYYKNCIVCPKLILLLKDLYFNYTQSMDTHMQNGTYFVPCISLFKECADSVENPSAVLGISWLNVVFQYLGMCNADYKERLHELYVSFAQDYTSRKCYSCTSDFFCNIFIPILDDMHFIDCLNGEYEFLILILHMVAALMGKPMVMDKLVKYVAGKNVKSYTFKNLHKKSVLFSSCYDLISLKPYNTRNVSCQPTKQMIAHTPFLYGYDPKNFPDNGILSQLFPFSSGSEIGTDSRNDTFAIQAKDLLPRLPVEWRNIISIYESNCNLINIKKRAQSSVLMQPISSIYFSILPNDAYMALYYISRVLSYYLKLSHFENEKHIFELYDAVLEKNLEKPAENAFKVADKVLSAIHKRLTMAMSVPKYYNTPELKNVPFDFFSKSFININTTSIPIFRHSTCSKSLVQFGECHAGSETVKDDKNAIHLILFLSTVLNIRKAVKLKTFLRFTREHAEKYQSLLLDIKYIDKNFYSHLIYISSAKQKGYVTLHKILKSTSKFPVMYLGLGMLRLLSIAKRLKKPNSLLLELIENHYSAYAEINTDIPMHLMINKMYFAFKSLNELHLFYPFVMAVSFAYGGYNVLQAMKTLLVDHFDCDESLLKPLSRQQIIKWNATFQDNKIQNSEDNTARDAGKKYIQYHFDNVMSKILTNSECMELRTCDLLYFIMHLHSPIKFTNYGVKFSNSENGFEFHSINFTQT